MKSLRKLPALLCVFCLALLLFTGCSGGGTEVTLQLDNKDYTGTYTGDMNDDKPDGEGKFVYEGDDGFTYEGHFANGMINGEGTLTYKDGITLKGTFEKGEIIPIQGDDIKTLFSDPESLKDQAILLVGQVFNGPTEEGDQVYVQIHTNISEYTDNVAVFYDPSMITLKDDDYITVLGAVGEVKSGTNIFGQTVSSPTVQALAIETVSYSDAASPTLATVDVNQTQDQYGYSITVQKVEYAADQTRVYVSVTNNGSADFSLYEFNCVISQNGKQYDEESDWKADYPEVSSDLKPGNTSEGVITFPGIEQASFQLTLDGSSDDWSQTIEDYVYQIDYTPTES